MVTAMNSADVFKVASQFRVPLNCQIEITRFCNLKCKHCYLPTSERKAMQFSDYLHYLDEINNAGCRFLTITGGEPLTHPEFSRFYEVAVKKGFCVSLFTNANGLTDEQLEVLSKHPPRCIEISAYGSDENTYQKVTGNRSAFTSVVDNIRRLKAAGLRVKLKTFITKDNFNDFAGIKSLILSLEGNDASTQNSILYDYKLLPRLDGSCDNLKYRIAPQEAFSLLCQESPDAKERWHTRIMDTAPIKTGKSQCGCGRHSFQIDVNGFVRTCTFNSYSSLDLNHASFSAIWTTYGEMLQKAQDDRNQESLCDNCKYANVCDICPAISFAESHVEYGNDAVPYQCEIAKLRYEYAMRTD